jgi:TatD DNase family protein
MLSAVNRYPGICHPMTGLHPTSVKSDYAAQLDKLEKLFDKRRFIAIGEIGIDLYWDKSLLKEQIISFRRQIAFAYDNSLPVVIHSREAFPEVFSVLDEFKGKKLKGVFHAFTGSVEDAEKAINLGFKLGIGGIITFKNSGLDRIVSETSPENLILETDSPYLAPVPYRGKRNESAYLNIINRKLADIFGIKEEEMASITYSNSVSLFNM